MYVCVCVSADGAVATADIGDDQVTTDKLAHSLGINGVT